MAVFLRKSAGTKNLKLLDRFEMNGRLYEAYELLNGNVIVVECEGGVLFVGDREAYHRYKKIIARRLRV